MNIKVANLLFIGLFMSLLGFAQNPIIQTYYTADPAPMVHNGTVYVYTSHDEDSTVNNFFTMFDWRCYSSKDMVSYDRSVGQNGIVSIDMTTEAFGFKEGRDGKPGTTYTEGPWFYKRNSLYYMVYVTKIDNSDYIKVSSADFGKGQLFNFDWWKFR